MNEAQLIKAVQDLQQTVDNLVNEVYDLEKKLNEHVGPRTYCPHTGKG